MHFNNDVVILAFIVLFIVGCCLALAGWALWKLIKNIFSDPVEEEQNDNN